MQDIMIQNQFDSGTGAATVPALHKSSMLSSRKPDLVDCNDFNTKRSAIRNQHKWNLALDTT